jgi:Na+/H+ antiporter NhaD/arsenite permease-like protein
MLNSWVGYLSLFLFTTALILVIFEEKIHLKKSKPVVLVGCLMWLIIGIYEKIHGTHGAHEFVEHLIAEIGGLFFFLLVAMTYINTLTSLNVFEALRGWLLSKGMGFKSLFWATGILTFLLSPLADNLTSALLMSTVAFAVSDGNKKFIVPAFVNIVVAANAGGAWSPFGDITTLMAWTAGKVHTLEFAYLVLPSVVNWIIPAFIMSLFIPEGKPQNTGGKTQMKPGAKRTMICFVLTIATGVCFHQFLDLPPFMGMMCGLGYLFFTSFYMKKWGLRKHQKKLGYGGTEIKHDCVYEQIKLVEFDTLLFFFGVLTAVGALQYIGFLSTVGGGFYDKLGYIYANTSIGVFSAIVDNIPIMYAVLNMGLDMGLDQWLLVTLTCGVGGSLLSIGSAAGVAVMGIEEDYTFMAHLKWTPVIALGYVASIITWWLVTMPLR